jgi:DNA adenine methylase
VAVEWLWMNYPQPFELHDYRFLGKDFRERERIKRKKARWLGKLKGMGQLERYAILEAVQELRHVE